MASSATSVTLNEGLSLLLPADIHLIITAVCTVQVRAVLVLISPVLGTVQVDYRSTNYEYCTGFVLSIAPIRAGPGRSLLHIIATALAHSTGYILYGTEYIPGRVQVRYRCGSSIG